MIFIPDKGGMKIMGHNSKFNQKSFAILESQLEASGKSQKQFCQEKGIAFTTFAYYRRKFSKNPSKSKNDFIKIVPASRTTQSNELEIIFPTGTTVKLAATKGLVNAIGELVKENLC